VEDIRKVQQRGEGEAVKKENGCTQYTVIKVRLHPTAEQADLIEKTFGSCRYLWNKMLTDVQEQLCQEITDQLIELIFNATLGNW